MDDTTSYAKNIARSLTNNISTFVRIKNYSKSQVLFIIMIILFIIGFIIFIINLITQKKNYNNEYVLYNKSTKETVTVYIFILKWCPISSEMRPMFDSFKKKLESMSWSNINYSAIIVDAEDTSNEHHDMIKQLGMKHFPCIYRKYNDVTTRLMLSNLDITEEILIEFATKDVPKDSSKQ